MTGRDQPARSILALDDLEHGEHAHEFVGAEHGDVPFSTRRKRPPALGRRAGSRSGDARPGAPIDALRLGSRSVVRTVG